VTASHGGKIFTRTHNVILRKQQRGAFQQLWKLIHSSAAFCLRYCTTCRKPLCYASCSAVRGPLNTRVNQFAQRDTSSSARRLTCRAARDGSHVGRHFHHERVACLVSAKICLV
jgi:hypothetical protein